MDLRSDYEVDKKRLCVVFKEKTADGAPKTHEFDETRLLKRIEMVEGGGKTAAVEKRALFDLQRQAQLR